MNLLQANGAQGIKPTKYAPIWVNRFFQGLWTQRSPLRDAGSTRLEEKFYGGRSDGLIDGSNVELTNRLTLARRPGLSQYNNAAIFDPVNSFYSFRFANGSGESIRVIADTNSAVMDITGPSTYSSVYAKSDTAGASTFKSVGNTLFWGDGAEQKKLLTSALWSANTAYTVGQFIVDENGNVQKVTTAGTSDSGEPTWATSYLATTSDNSVTWTCYGSAVMNWGIAAPTAAPGVAPVGSNRLWAPQMTVTMPYSIVDVYGNVQIALGAGGAVQVGNTAGVSGTTYPMWNRNVGGSTTDGTVIWRNCGGMGSWAPSTNYPSYSPIVDPSGNLQIASVATGTQHGSADVTGYTSRESGANSDTLYSFVVIAVFADATHTGASNVISTHATHFQINWNPVPGVDHYNVYCTVAVQGSAGALTTTVGKQHGTGSSSSTEFGGGPNYAATVTSLYMDDGSWFPFIGDGATPPTNNTSTTSGLYQESGTTIPQFKTAVGDTITDGNGVQPPVVWMCYGTAQASVFTGYKWVYAYHCVDGHVSTASPVLMTGPINGQSYVVTLNGVGSGDPQCDEIWMFRTVDGGGTFLYVDSVANPGSGNTWTYQDTAVDADLNIFKQAPVDSANDPPQTGSVAPEYHLGRLWVAVGNTVYYSQSYVSVGVAVQSFPPLNYFIFPSKVTRLLSTTVGLLVFTVSDIFIIQGNGVSTALFAQLFLKGIGLLSYNALDVNGSTILMMTSDGQMISLEPNSGVSEIGFPIGDRLAGFDPSTAYVTWHVSGSADKAIYVSDGSTGWYRCNPTSAPENGLTWSPFATVTNGCTAVQSIEVSPGVHRLLIGPPVTPLGVTVTKSARVVESRTDGSRHVDELVYTSTGGETSFSFDLQGPIPCSMYLRHILDTTDHYDLMAEANGAIGESTTFSISSNVLTATLTQLPSSGAFDIVVGRQFRLGADFYYAGSFPVQQLAGKHVTITAYNTSTHVVTATFVESVPDYTSVSFDILSFIPYIVNFSGANINYGSSYLTGATVNFDTGHVGITCNALPTGVHFYATYGTRRSNYGDFRLPWTNLDALAAGTGAATATLTAKRNIASGINQFNGSQLLVCRDFGFDIPAQARINTINAYISGSTVDANPLPWLYATGVLNYGYLIDNVFQGGPMVSCFGCDLPDPYYGDSNGRYFWGDDRFSQFDSLDPTWPGAVANDGTVETYTIPLVTSATPEQASSSGMGFAIAAVYGTTGGSSTVTVNSATMTVIYQVPAGILQRDPSVWDDNGTPYESYGVIGSLILAQPGQMAEVAFLAMDAPLIAGANPPVLGVILDEALPYYTGDFTMLTDVVNDPPQLPASTSLYSKRAWMNQSRQAAWCRSMQIKIDFGADSYQEELLTLTLYGSVYSEL